MNFEEVVEEGIKIKVPKADILTKDLPAFYNKEMKINRDLSLLVIKSYFSKPISFCDPLAATGIREMRFVKSLPKSFRKIIVGDISSTALNELQNGFKKNNLSFENVEVCEALAHETMLKDYFDMIEIDPFGTPVPFLDLALQRLKHNGILSVTATDTAALCGTYPKTSLRRYGIHTTMTYFHEEFGLRNLIAYVQREAAKHEKRAIVLISCTSKHFYKIFFKIEESRQKSYRDLLEHKWFSWDRMTQEFQLKDEFHKGDLGKTYVGTLCDKEFVKKLISNIELIQDSKEVEKLLTKLSEELEIPFYINPHKLEKSYSFSSSLKYSQLFDLIESRGYKVSRVHNNRFGIKTTMGVKELVELLKNAKKIKKRVIPYSLLLSVYLLVPIVFVIVLFDILLFDSWLKGVLPYSPYELIFFSLAFNLPHIITSFMSYCDKEYLIYYKKRLIIGLPIIVIMGLFLAYLDSVVSIAAYVFYTIYHVLMQQLGIATMMMGAISIFYKFWRWICVIIGALLYGMVYYKGAFEIGLVNTFFNIQFIDSVLFPFLILIFFILFCLTIKLSKTKMGLYYHIGNFSMVLLAYACYVLDYRFFIIFLVRPIHDITAFIFYAVHDNNRASENAKANFILRWFTMYNISLLIASPLLGIFIAYFAKLYLVGLLASLYIVSFTHYYLEGFMWKKGSIHRSKISFKT